MHIQKTSLFLCALLLALASPIYAHDEHGSHKCTHDDKPHPDFEFLDVEEDMSAAGQEGRLLASSASTYRMMANYDQVTTSTSFKSYMQNSLGPAVLSFFSSALKVRYPVSGLLKVKTSTICGISTPSVLKSGANADYYIFFESDFDDASNWVAESYTCMLATGTKRPLIARTVLNTNLFKNPGSDVLLHEKNIYLVLHEMTHTLAFSSNLYKYFLDDNGKQRSGHIKSASLGSGTSTVLNLPDLTARLQKHFGCSTLSGAYMENSGSSATAASHFERRQFGFEAMTSGLIYQQTYSEFTLALLEGSGWYVANYDYADPHFFGQGEGCNFLTQSCSSSTPKFDDFCSGSSRGCTVQGRGGGSCSSDTRSDNCKFIHPNVNYDCDNDGASRYARLPALQAFGRSANSKCFTGTLSTSKSASNTSFCFKYTCQGSDTNTVLQVSIGSKSVTCRQAGAVTVSGYYGAVNCPDPVAFCSTIGKAHCPRNCMGRGTCVDGKCQCRSGFSGKDCAAI